MTPHRDRDRGTFLLDRSFKGVGRVKRASGTKEPRMVKALDAMLTALHQAGRDDILKAIRAKSLTPLEVWTRFRVGELDRLPTAETMRGLSETFWQWAERAETGTWNKRSRTSAASVIERRAPKSASLTDLPALLRDYMREAPAAQANHVRSHCLAFFRDLLGRSHALYMQARDLRPRKVNPRKRVRLSVTEARHLVAKLGELYGAILWAMATTGMGPGELWGEWSVLTDPPRVKIEGTKRKGRIREIPFVAPIDLPPRCEKMFGRKLIEATDGAVQPYDLRGTFAHWMEEAGIPRTRRRLYLGHGAKDVSDLYERHEVKAFLVADGEKLRRYIGGDSGPEKALRIG